MRYQNCSLRQHEISNHNGAVTGLAIDGRGEVWAVGGEYLTDPETRPQGTFILRRGEGAWGSVETPTEFPLWDVAFSADGPGWAIA